MEYQAKIKPSKKVLSIKTADGDELKIELKPETIEYDVQHLAERLTEITAHPISLTIAEEADIEVKIKGKRRR